MRLVLLLLIVSVAIVLTAYSSSTSKVTAITNVDVLTMVQPKILRDHTVIVRDGKIAELGPFNTIKVPAEAGRIDGNGLYLIPGLVDFHIHLRSQIELHSYLVHGVTTVVNLSGNSDVLGIRKQISEGEVLGPTLFTSGPILDGDPPIYPRISRIVTSPEEATRLVAEQKRAGYDFVKVYNNLRPNVLFAVTGAAKQNGMPVAGHIPRKDGREQALQLATKAGLDLIAHGEEYFFTYFYANVESALDRGLIPEIDESRITDVVQMTKHTAVIPNLSFIAMTRKQLDDMEEVLDDPEARYLDPEVLEMWKKQNPNQRPDRERFNKRERAKYPFVKKLTRALSDGGVLLLAGTDASASGLFPGKSLHLELKELVAAGLTEFQAISTATANAGKFFQQHLPATAPFGIISPGNRADLLLLEANPLIEIENVSRIRGVMVRGEYFGLAELLTLRANKLKSQLLLDDGSVRPSR